MSDSITMMKKDAVINLQIGTGFLSKIQQVLSGLVSERTTEELDEFSKLVQKGETTFPEQWMDHIFTLSTFIRLVEIEAVNQNATYKQDFNNTSVPEN